MTKIVQNFIPKKYKINNNDLGQTYVEYFTHHETENKKKISVMDKSEQIIVTINEIKSNDRNSIYQNLKHPMSKPTFYRILQKLEKMGRITKKSGYFEVV